MATTVSDILYDAYRDANIVAIGQAPSAAQYDEALRLLNRFRSSVIGNEASEQLDPIIVGRNNLNRPKGYPWYPQVPDNVDWFVPENSRLFCNLTSAQTVYLHPNPNDGARFAFIDKSSNFATYPLTVNANGRTIAGATQATFSSSSAYNEYFYRADTGDWAKVSPLIASDPWPFPEDFDDMFVIGVASRLNPRYDAETSSETLAHFKRLRGLFQARYRQHRETGSELGLIRTSGVRHRYYDNNRFAQSAFDSGYAFPFGYRYLG